MLLKCLLNLFEAAVKLVQQVTSVLERDDAQPKRNKTIIAIQSDVKDT